MTALPRHPDRPVRPSRIALVAGPDPGHALPVLGIGAALVARGHECVLWTGSPHLAACGRHGVGWAELPLLAPQAGDVDLGFRLWGRATEMAPPLATELRAFDPALVVVDTLTRAGAFAAQLVGVPHLEVVPHHLADPAMDLPPVGLGRPLARTPWRRADDRQLVRRQLGSVAAGAAQGTLAAQRLGLVAVEPPTLRLLQTLPSLERRRRSWPTDAHVVGALAVEPELPPLAPPEGDAPLVVVTDSTATGAGHRLGEAALAGLTRLDLRVVVTSARLAPRDDGHTVVGVGPHGPLLRQAALAVSPGGGGFVTRAAAHGVPQVVAPLHGDQREAAARLRDTGAGRTLRRITPRTLRWGIVTALADRRAGTAAAALAAEADTLGPSVAADLVEAVLAGHVPVARGRRPTGSRSLQEVTGA